MATKAPLVVRSGFRSRLAAFTKAITYLILAFAGALLVSAAAKGLFGVSLIELAKGGSETGAVRAIFLLCGVIVIPTALVLKVFREPFPLSGWALARAKRLMVWGLGTGLTLLAAIAGVMWLLGAVTFGIATPHAPATFSGLAMSAILWLAQATVEEGLNRGYAFAQMSRALSFWPAAILSNAAFLYGHVANPGETVFGIIATGLLGLALSYSLLKTGSLWFALGFHASWNFSQSFIFGFANSGSAPSTSVLVSTIDGSPWLTGGTAGPEASLLVLPALIALFAIIQRVATPDCQHAGSPAHKPARVRHERVDAAR